MAVATDDVADVADELLMNPTDNLSVTSVKLSVAAVTIWRQLQKE
ncbi:MAG: hypothetical protein VKL59_03500 [Nostocaceae cyanobacterium]|nr:hypothetical protein [Nostocaceae cyanobacterium]